MAYRLELLPSAVKQLAALSLRPRRMVASRIDALEQDPRPPGSKALKGRGKGLYRLRAGPHRILYRVKDEALVVLVLKIGDRRDIYRGL